MYTQAIYHLLFQLMYIHCIYTLGFFRVTVDTLGLRGLRSRVPTCWQSPPAPRRRRLDQPSPWPRLARPAPSWVTRGPSSRLLLCIVAEHYVRHAPRQSVPTLRRASWPYRRRPSGGHPTRKAAERRPPTAGGRDVTGTTKTHSRRASVRLRTIAWASAEGITTTPCRVSSDTVRRQQTESQ